MRAFDTRWRCEPHGAGAHDGQIRAGWKSLAGYGGAHELRDFQPAQNPGWQRRGRSRGTSWGERGTRCLSESKNFAAGTIWIEQFRSDDSDRQRRHSDDWRIAAATQPRAPDG